MTHICHNLANIFKDDQTTILQFLFMLVFFSCIIVLQTILEI